jgi:hypothetical protein
MLQQIAEMHDDEDGYDVAVAQVVNGLLWKSSALIEALAEEANKPADEIMARLRRKVEALQRGEDA